jgi:hypothetical protein
VNDVAEPSVLVRKGGGLAQHLDGAGDRPQRVADLVRESGGDPTQDREALGFLRADGGSLQRTPRQSQAIGQIAREQSHDGHSQRIEQQRVDEVARGDRVRARRLVRRRQDPPEVKARAQRGVDADAEGCGEPCPARTHEDRADEARQRVEGGRPARRAAGDVDNRGPRQLVQNDLGPRERQKAAARAQDGAVPHGLRKPGDDGQEDDPQADRVSRELPSQVQRRRRPEQQDQEAQS